MPIKAIVDGVEKDITRIPVLANGMYKDTWEVRDNQDRLLWYRDDTLTGISPISFRGYGIPLNSIKIVGNTQQNGTPTPDAPIMPEFVGVRTENLAPPLTEWVDGYVSADGTIQPPDGNVQQKSSGYLSVEGRETYTFSIENGFPTGMTAPWRAIGWYAQDKTFISREGGNVNGALSTSAPLNAAYCRLSYRTHGKKTNPVFNLGSTAFPYEPYGWAEKITCAGQTVSIYLEQTQTVRRVRKLVFDGTESIASSHSDIGLFNIDLTGYLKTNNSITTVCSHYKAIANQNTWSGVADKSVCIYGNPGNPEQILYIRDSDYSTVADFKAYLAAQYAAGTPVAVWYVLAEPETAIVNEPLAKIGNYADEVITVPGITPQTGTNTLTVDTTLSPSLLSITGHIKETV